MSSQSSSGSEGTWMPRSVSSRAAASIIRSLSIMYVGAVRDTGGRRMDFRRCIVVLLF
jgi:hypothetical protein